MRTRVTAPAHSKTGEAAVGIVPSTRWPSGRSTTNSPFAARNAWSVPKPVSAQTTASVTS